MKEVIANQDINSHVRNKYIYAKKGDKLKLIKEIGDVLIVANKKESFPVTKDKVSDIPEKKLPKIEGKLTQKGLF